MLQESCIPEFQSKNDLKIIKSIEESQIYQLCMICKEVGALHLGIIDHPKILGRILVDYNDSLAVEIPCWKNIGEDDID